MAQKLRLLLSGSNFIANRRNDDSAQCDEKYGQDRENIYLGKQDFLAKMTQISGRHQ